MTNNLTGKVALVTGGSRGIGAAIAKRLARDGAAVAITYAHTQQKADEVVRAIEATGGRALAIRADSADVEAVKGWMALGRYGQGDEIAGMVAYLASPEAGFVTGASLTIDGGFAA
jgi:NAD(P)-dependent dehydrogenase (short-subunit alcohol dehydrogenase family)